VEKGWVVGTAEATATNAVSGSARVSESWAAIPCEVVVVVVQVVPEPDRANVCAVVACRVEEVVWAAVWCLE